MSNKTIKDAYEELKGDLKNSIRYRGDERHVLYCIVGGEYVASSNPNVTAGQHQYICTVEEFNNYKDTKVDCTSEEFWKDAPEGATHYMPESDGWHKAWFTITEKTKTMIRVGFHDVFGCAGYELSQLISDGLIPRPKPSPVFTQSMSDANELPSVGAEVLFNDDTDFDCKFDFVDGDLMVCMCHSIDSNGKSIGVYRHRDGVTISLKSDLIKPLPTPIQLEDGKAYQFEHKDKGVLDGTYDDNGKVFWSKSHPCHLGCCTNIKPLTVEGE